MVTALTLYATNTNDATLTTGRTLVGTSGAPSTTPITTKCGNASTGYSQIFSQGSAATWAALGAIAAPNGKGFVLPTSVLDLSGNQFVAGNWTMRVRANVSNGTVACDLYVPVYLYNTGGATYSAPLFTLQLLTQTLTTTSSNFDFTATAEPLINVLKNQLVYFEVWCNIGTNSTGNASATVGLIENISSTIGATASTNLATPGYQAIPASKQTVTGLHRAIARAQ